MPYLDKLVHATVFAAVALTGRRAGVPCGPLAGVLAAHAVLSEVIQGALLPGRQSDPWDVAADVAGTALGLVGGRRPQRGTR